MSLLSMMRRSSVVVLTLFFVALFSAFAWSDEPSPSSKIKVTSRGCAAN